MTARQIHLPDGRALGLTGLGDALARRLVVFCHPSPGAGGFDPDPGVTAPWGLHMVSLDRPGYGGSDPLPDQADASFADHADDIAAFVTRSEKNARSIGDLDFGPIGAIGWGTGGLVALALAARHPRLVDRVAVIDTPSPSTFPRRIPAGPPYDAQSLGIAANDPVLQTPSVAHRLERMLQSAQTHGVTGTRFDQVAYGNRQWMSDLGSIRAQVLLIYGEDNPVTQADLDGQWFHRRIPDSRVVRVQNGRGLSIVSCWRRILSHVAPHHGDVAPASRR